MYKRDGEMITKCEGKEKWEKKSTHNFFNSSQYYANNHNDCNNYESAESSFM